MATLKDKLEWIGAIAVVASLLLVAYEVRQNTNTVSAQAIYDLNQMGNDLLMTVSANPEYGHIVNTGNLDPDELDADEWFRYQRYVWLNLNMAEAAWGYYERGLLDDSFIEALKHEHCEKTSQPGYQRAIPSLTVWNESEFLRMAQSWCSDAE